MALCPKCFNKNKSMWADHCPDCTHKTDFGEQMEFSAMVTGFQVVLIIVFFAWLFG
jgi:hypothetical protein